VSAAKKAASADFAKLVEMFDEHGVPFVSVTQSFNTTTSMGRLTLNVLLSFAQFERNLSPWTLSLRRQCALLGVARSGVYRPRKPANDNDAALMRRMVVVQTL
jgi:DNA invertase Pin-like site-specific DNA recombinase